MRVLIVNQHADNRGDEAALRAMVRSIGARFPGASFVVLAQTRGDLPLRGMDQPVEARSMILPPIDAARLAAYVAAAALGVRVPSLLSAPAAAIVDAYRAADVVVTAPGGPYFGDIYADHELLHWLFVYLARLHGRPVFQYAPSCGPFAMRPLNWLRRRFYGWIDVLVVREEISGEHLRRLLGPGVPVHVTIDAAVQDILPALPRDEYFRGARASLRHRFLVAVTGQQYRFPGAADGRRRQAAYERAMLACLEHLASRVECHVLFFPQLCGAHSDVAFHRYLAGRLPAGLSWEIVDPDLDSDGQRRLFGMADFCLASRYHPQVFATAHGVPGIFITYEHKQRGYLGQLGLDPYVFDIREPDEAEMRRAVDEVLQRRTELSAQLRQRIEPLRRASAHTTELLCGLLAAAPVRVRMHERAVDDLAS